MIQIMAVGITVEQITAFLNDYIIPFGTTLLYTVGPVLAPYISSRISTKFSALTALINTEVGAVNTSLSERIGKLETKVNELATIPAQVQTLVAPLLEKDRVIISILLTIADNSRIPSEVKASIKTLYSDSVDSEKAVAAALAEKEQVITDLTLQLKGLKDKAIEDDAKKTQVEAVAVTTKKSKKVNNNW